MDEKVKVSREVAEAVDFVKNEAEIPFKEVMGIMLEGGFSRLENQKAYPLNDLSLEKVAKVLINGYEIEKTPEEKVLAEFEKMHNGSTFSQAYIDGFGDGVIAVLQAYDLKIEGIND